MGKQNGSLRTRILVGLLLLAVFMIVVSIPVAWGLMKSFTGWEYRITHCRVCDKPASHVIVESRSDSWQSDQFSLCDEHAKEYQAATAAKAAAFRSQKP